jgi:hypothetical protein
LTTEERYRAALAFFGTPLQKELFATLRREYLDSIAASGLSDTSKRETYYLAVQALEQMAGTLENWARKTR